MATSCSTAYLLLPPNCSNQSSAAVPSRSIRVGYGHHKPLISCSPQCSMSSAMCGQQEHTKFSFLHHGFSSHFNRNQRSENGSWLDGSRRSSRSTWRSRGRAIATASSAVDETVVEEVTVKIKVGPVRSLRERVYKFQKIFGPSSSIVVVTLPKPLGIVFVESPLKNAYGKNRIMVGELVVGGNAERAARVAQLFVGAPRNIAQSNIPILNGGVMPGDILRATTTAGVLVDFFGIRRPVRVMDLYIADGRPWHLVMRALNASFVADGDLTLVFERRNTNI
ncbi:hypothetical protein M758_4G042200 [Ceratodon purpureus]|nr:hypothetical protein M758_4G042200 [Ceratodon purpureus]